MTCACCQGACCNGTSCTLTTADNCVGFNVSFRGAGTTCSPNPCQGACCYGTLYATCTVTTQSQCSSVFAGQFRGGGTSCFPNPCVNCSSNNVAFPATVYRTGGIPSTSGCNPVQVGTLNGPGDFITVWGQFSATYSSVEAQVKDACNRCVWSGNNAVSGGGTASLGIGGGDLQVNYPFRNTCPGSPAPCWCNNPMCNPLP
jgi:hypothetical protein